MENINVLYIDNDLNNQESFRNNFNSHYNVFTASSLVAAGLISALNEIHVLVADQKSLLTAGTHILEEITRLYPQQIIILLTANPKNEIPELMGSGLIFRYMRKSYEPEVLKQVIDASHYLYILKMKEKQLHKDLIKTQNELDMLRK